MVDAMDDDSTVMAANAKRLGLLPEDRTYLLVLTGPLAGRIIALTGTLVIGRGAEADIRIADEESLSRRHCRLFVKDGNAYVEDMQSKHGTYVNGKYVQSEKLRDGDKIRVGGTTLLKFSHDEDNLAEIFQRRS